MSLDESVSGLSSKWNERAAAAQKMGVPQGYVEKLAREDFQKVIKGRTPSSDIEAATALASIVKGKGLVSKDRDDASWSPLKIAENAIGDVKDIATGFLPGLASEAVNFPKHLVDAGLILGGRDDVAQKYGIEDWGVDFTPSGIAEALRDASKVPLVNYIPGLYTAANLTTEEGRDELLGNPLITALDVLPVAKGASMLGSKLAGIETVASLDRAASKASQLATEGAINKLAEGKRLNWKDLEGMSNAGLEEVIRHAEDANTPIKVSGRDYGRARQLLDKRQAGLANEPTFRPTREVVTQTEQLVPDPEWQNPLGWAEEVESITPEETSAIRTVLQRTVDDIYQATESNPKLRAQALPDIGDGLTKIELPANEYGPATTHYVKVGKNGTVDAFLSLTKEAGETVWRNADTDMPVTVKGPAGNVNGRAYTWIEESESAIPTDEIINTGKTSVDMIFRDPKKRSLKGISQKLYQAADNEGWDIANATASGMTDAGRAARAKYLGLDLKPPMIKQMVDEVQTVPMEHVPEGSVAEAFAEGKPVKAFSRATGLSDKVIKPMAERLGVTEGMRQIYSAFGGIIPRKYQPQLERIMEQVGGALGELHDTLPVEKQATFYKDLMEAAMKSADTIKVIDLEPEISAGLSILREQMDNTAKALVNDGKVVPVLLPEGGTALYSVNSPVVKLWQKIDALMQRRPDDYVPGSQDPKHVKWTEKLQKARNEYEKVLNENAPLSFQKLIEDKVLNQVALTLMADENKVRFATEAADITDRLRSGKNVTTDELSKVPTQVLQHILENDTKGMSSRQLSKINREINLRNASGNPGPESIMTPQMAEQIIQKIRTGDYLRYMTKEELDGIIAEQIKTWRDMKAQGYDPIPVPYVKKPHDIFDESFIQPIPEGVSATDLDRFRTAVFDFKPYYNDLSMALSREAVEYLRHEATKTFHNDYVAKLSVDPEAVLTEYAKMYPDLDRAELREKILQDYVPYDATMDRPFKAEWPLGVKDTGARLLPKNVANNVHNLAPRNRLPIKGVVDKINKTFRFAVLTNPRHMADVAFGGMLEMMTRDPMAITKIREAFSMAKEKRMPVDLPRSIDGFATHEIFNYAGGRTIGRLANSYVKNFRKLEEFITDVQRSMDYIYNRDKKLAKGYSDKYAHQASIEAASKALATYEDMSPFERQYLRTFLPFYGFTRHMTRYLLSYPGDHPIKASILSKMAATEINDWNSGLPQTWASLFFLGAPNTEGDQWAMDLRVLNPFRTAYNNFTFAGILSQQTPFIGAPMTFLGLDPASGSGELYPELSYDPATGSLVTKRRDGFVKVLSQFVPQVGAVDYAFGLSDEMRRLQKDNPDAARQRMFSIFGLNFLPKEVNIPTQIARTQKNQVTDATEAVSRAMAGGSTKEVRQYSMVPFQGQLLPGDQVADMIDRLKEIISDNDQLNSLGVTPRALLGR